MFCTLLGCWLSTKLTSRFVLLVGNFASECGTPAAASKWKMASTREKGSFVSPSQSLFEVFLEGVFSSFSLLAASRWPAELGPVRSTDLRANQTPKLSNLSLFPCHLTPTSNSSHKPRLARLTPPLPPLEPPAVEPPVVLLLPPQKSQHVKPGARKLEAHHPSASTSTFPSRTASRSNSLGRTRDS